MNCKEAASPMPVPQTCGTTVVFHAWAMAAIFLHSVKPTGSNDGRRTRFGVPARLIRQWPCRAAYRSAAFKNARAGVVYALFPPSWWPP